MLAKVAVRLCLIFVPLVAFGQQDPVSIWYTANVGILIEAGETRILVDSFFRQHPEWEGFPVKTAEPVVLDGNLDDNVSLTTV